MIVPGTVLSRKYSKPWGEVRVLKVNSDNAVELLALHLLAGMDVGCALLPMPRNMWCGGSRRVSPACVSHSSMLCQVGTSMRVVRLVGQNASQPDIG